MIGTNFEQFLSQSLVANYISITQNYHMQFSKRNKQTPLLPLPEIKFNLPPKSGDSRDQLRPGSLFHKRKEPGNEVGM
jgi:hypothetical protein